jgi:hypothetical protein
MTRAALLLMLAGVAASARTARADSPADHAGAFEVDREVPPPGQGELSFDGGAPLLGPWAASVQLGYLDRPFRLHTTEIKIFPIEHRQTVALGGAVAIGPSIIADVRMPLAHQIGDRMQGLGDDRPLDRWVQGDITVGLRLRLSAREQTSLFVRGVVTVPTGDDFDYAGEARFTAAWALIGRFTLPYGFVAAATAGVRFRGREVIVADRTLSDELFGAIGVTYALPAIRGLYCEENQVRVTGELVGVLGNDVGDKEGASPVEARIGLISRVRPWLAIAGRVGKGIGDQVGNPRFRGMLELVFTAP